MTTPVKPDPFAALDQDPFAALDTPHVAPPKDDHPGLIARIAAGLAQIPKDAYNAVFTPVQGTNKPTNPGRAGWPGGVRPADAGAVITPENTPGSITPEEQRNAGIHTIGNLASALVGAPEVEALGAGNKLSLAKRAIQGAMLGGKVGAISGFAQADQAPGTSLPDALAGRVKGALGGAASGAVLGGALPAAGMLAGKVINSAPVAATVDALSSLTPGLSIGEPTEAQQISQRIFGDAKPRNVKRFLGNYEGAVDKSGLNPTAEMARLNGPFLSPGAPSVATMGDVAGDPGVQLTGALARTPNSSAGQKLKDAALARSAGRGARLQAGLEAATGEDTALPQLPSQIEAAAKPNIEELYATAQQAPPIPLTPAQQQVLAHPNIAKAFRAAQQENSGLLSAGQDQPLQPFTLNDRLNAGLPVSDADKLALQKARVAAMIGGKDAAPIVSSEIDANTLDKVIQKLGDQIDQAGGPKFARDLVAQKSVLSDALDQSPEFRAAKDAFAASKQRQEAAVAGQKVGSLTGANDKQIEGMVNGTLPLPGESEATGFPMSPEAEQEFRRGFAGTLGQNLRDLKTNAILSNDRSVVMDSRLRAGLGNDVADKFMPVAQAEAEMKKMEQQVLGGSQTAERVAQDQAFNDNPTADVLSSGLSNIGGMSPQSRLAKMGFSAARKGVKNWAGGINAGTADAGANFMLANPIDAQRLLAIRKIAQAKQAQLLAKAGGVGANLSQQP